MDKKIVMFCLCALIAIFVIPSVIFAASFDCNRAQGKVEKLICSTPDLSRMDEQLAKVYQNALANAKNVEQKNNLIDRQKDWLRQTRKTCGDADCLIKAYSSRLSELSVETPLITKTSPNPSNPNSFCESISKIISLESSQNAAIKATGSRALTKEENKILELSKLDFFESPGDYSSGTDVIDIDNDGKKEVFAYNIQGSGRFVYIAAFDLPANTKRVEQLFTGEAGVLSNPYFINYKGKNYLITSGDDGNGTIVSEISRYGKTFKQTIHCASQTKINVQSACKHSACKGLVDRITKNIGGEFSTVVWPHKYMAPVGIQVFTHDNPIAIDYDNSGTTRYLWKLGRKGYIFENIYWSWMGEGSQTVAPASARPESDTNEPREVIPGAKHDNLRKTIKQHEVLLQKNNILKTTDKLPRDGEFFFLKHEGLTYWVWETGEEAAWGSLMHILLTKSGQSEYIGSVSTKQVESLVPCNKACLKTLGND